MTTGHLCDRAVLHPPSLSFLLCKVRKQGGDLLYRPRALGQGR